MIEIGTCFPSERKGAERKILASPGKTKEFLAVQMNLEVLVSTLQMLSGNSLEGHNEADLGGGLT